MSAENDIAYLQAALRELWPDRPKVYLSHASAASDGVLLTPEEQTELFLRAEEIRCRAF